VQEWRMPELLPAKQTKAHEREERNDYERLQKAISCAASQRGSEIERHFRRAYYA
jgi:hypothetical protein